MPSPLSVYFQNLFNSNLLSPFLGNDFYKTKTNPSKYIKCLIKVFRLIGKSNLIHFPYFIKHRLP